mmetsp:Transcript_4427/g.6502  ORF Transcript_4427/g.6502 Transcript_4427/m.6502 type:complete len:89 (+) Transcript_4427:622-888(+)
MPDWIEVVLLDRLCNMDDWRCILSTIQHNFHKKEVDAATATDTVATPKLPSLVVWVGCNHSRFFGVGLIAAADIYPHLCSIIDFGFRT